MGCLCDERLREAAICALMCEDNGWAGCSHMEKACRRIRARKLQSQLAARHM